MHVGGRVLVLCSIVQSELTQQLVHKLVFGHSSELWKSLQAMQHRCTAKGTSWALDRVLDSPLGKRVITRGIGRHLGAPRLCAGPTGIEIAAHVSSTWSGQLSALHNARSSVRDRRCTVKVTKISADHPGPTTVCVCNADSAKQALHALSNPVERA